MDKSQDELMPRRLNTCTLYSKYTAFCMEFLLFCLGCAVFGGAVWLLVSEDVWTEMLDRSHLRMGAIVLVTSTVVMVLVAVIAMWGTLVESRCTIIFTLFVSIIVFCLMLTAGILGVIAKAHYPEELRVQMIESIKTYYGVNRGDPYHDKITDTWDRIQQNEECCAVNDQSWSIYQNSRWYRGATATNVNAAKVPESCCRKDQYGQYIGVFKCQTWDGGPPTYQAEIYADNNALIYRGCLGVVEELLQKKSDFIIGVGFGSAIYLLIICVLKGIMACRLPSESI